MPWEKENMSDQSSVIVDRADNFRTRIDRATARLFAALGQTLGR